MGGDIKRIANGKNLSPLMQPSDSPDPSIYWFMPSVSRSSTAQGWSYPLGAARPVSISDIVQFCDGIAET